MCIVRTDFKTFTEESKWNGIQIISPYVHYGKGLCIASDFLWNDAKERGGIAVNIAYTNYGGDIHGKNSDEVHFREVSGGHHNGGYIMGRNERLCFREYC